MSAFFSFFCICLCPDSFLQESVSQPSSQKANQLAKYLTHKISCPLLEKDLNMPFYWRSTSKILDFLMFSPWQRPFRNPVHRVVARSSAKRDQPECLGVAPQLRHLQKRPLLGSQKTKKRTFIYNVILCNITSSLGGLGLQMSKISTNFLLSSPFGQGLEAKR